MPRVTSAMTSVTTFPCRAYQEAADFLRAHIPRPPVAALVLGSGLDRLAHLMQNVHVIPYAAIPHFAPSTAPGHRGELMVGQVNGVDVVCLRGRLHMYEGYTPQEITVPIRALRCLEIGTLILTNAAGGVNPGFHVGDIMLIEDHISLPGLAGLNPLHGANVDAQGERFPALNQAYSPRLLTLAREQALQQGLSLQQGVYIHVAGPNFETPAEIRMLRHFGADAVGMSTVPEVIVARHAGMEVLALSTITNLCVDDTAAVTRPDSTEVIVAASMATQAYQALLPAILTRINTPPASGPG